MRSQGLVVRVDGDGPPLVLVHGLSGTPRLWERLTPALRGRRRLLLVDPVARPRAQRRPLRFVLAEVADALATELADLPEPSCDMVGHSMGGLIVAALAARHPDRVRRLVLVDTPASPLQVRMARRALAVARSTGAGRFEADTFRLLAAGLARTGPRTLVSALRQTLDADLEAELRSIAAPVLLIWGEHDVLVPLEVALRMHAAIPDARLTVVPGASHMPMWERPEAFSALVARFLDGDAMAR